MLLSGRHDGQIVILPGQYNKYAFLPSVSDSFALRIKSLMSGGLVVRGHVGGVAMQKVAFGNVNLCVQGDFMQTPERYAVLGGAIVGTMTLGNQGCCQKATKSCADVSISGTVVVDNSKHVDTTSGFSVLGVASPTLCWCASGSNGVTITASASCTSFRMRQLGDLSGDTFADISSISLREFYYTPHAALLE